MVDDAWRAGREIVSEMRPRVELYPNFLSAPELLALLDLVSRAEATEAAEVQTAAEELAAATDAVSYETVSYETVSDGESDGGSSTALEEEEPHGKTTSVPIIGEEPIVRMLEERCCLATGVPSHPDEDPLGIRRTEESSAAAWAQRHVHQLHVDTNNGGLHRWDAFSVHLSGGMLPWTTTYRAISPVP